MQEKKYNNLAIISFCTFKADQNITCISYNGLWFRFTKTYQNRVETALPYAMQSEFSRVLASEMVCKNTKYLY